MTNQKISNHTNIDLANNELLGLSDMWRAISHFWKLIIFITLLCALIGLGLASILPKEWEAQATLRIGHIPSNTGDESKPIEDPLQTVERIKPLGFKQKVLTDLNLPLELGINKRSDLLIKSLKANAIANTDFISLSVRGYSEKDAADNMNAAVQEIKKNHLLMEQPLKGKIQTELKANIENLASASAELARLKDKMIIVDAHKSSSDFAPSIIVVNMLVAKEAEVRSLKDQQIQYNARLSAFDEQTTALVDTVDVSSKPIFPKRNIFIIISALLGLFIGAWTALLKDRNRGSS